ncbi:MAG: hypothetical protein BMS9Abin23_0002 [Thermodesulfobacteriota bacterium]|nr:MAG: hypothetical protein BMS9Abin23_0002 [Thermodesulfobacteriota bacterium]
MLFWILIILLIHGIGSFAYAVVSAADSTTAWAMFSMSFVFLLGITQTGAAFSAIMKISKSGWGSYYSRLGEILNLSFIPVVIVMFLVIYFGGMEHLFYWAAPHAEGAAGEHVSPWLGKGLFFWRFFITQALFYLASYIYFYRGREDERKRELTGSSKGMTNIPPAFVCIFYVIANTNLAWEFGMTAIKHWESTIFAPYFWSGNLLVGTAFLFLISLHFLRRAPGIGHDKNTLDSMAKVLLGFALLVIYMFWSQHIVAWYGSVPARSGPVFKQMRGVFSPAFTLMILGVFFLPFLALLYRRFKQSANALAVVAVIIIVGMLANRYLMIIPIYTDGDVSAAANWAGVALIAGGISAALLSIKCFLLLFPEVTVTTAIVKKGH